MSDLVERQDVIEIVHFECEDWKGLATGIESMIKELPSMETATSWISVSERLPEKEGSYLVTARWSDSDEYNVYILDYGFKVNNIWEGSDRVFKNGGAFGEWWGKELDNLEEVIAWMPIPERYVGEK